MSGTVFAVVILAAALHATWNALVKGGADKAAAMGAVVMGQGVFGVVVLAFAGLPGAACLPYLAAGVALHMGYQLFLIMAYRIGDLTQVYPIARGVAPLLVAVVSVGVLGVEFSRSELIAMGMISIGIASISLVRRRDGLLQGKATGLALITGVFIASYSITDGQGARLGGTALGYYGVMSVLDALLFAATLRVARPGLLGRSLRHRRHLFLGGGASFVAYALVVWSFTQAPIALVTALRETSILFALGIGVFVLREPLNLGKVLSTALTLAGVIFLRLGRG
ncbi:DMT family transporter [Acidimangrovimonas sediminis]|uniref:DMT family transporter n=1 Tax=Acidimangrovimonas sediminis TaxID=2056283 RepID=UPI000C7FE66E|nr:DMT family transporter [Acidimangrovimonas sediminis]